MLLSETTEILWRIARMDHQPRDTSDEAVMAWHELIGHLVFEDARAAVDWHRRHETCWLQPAHVIRRAESIAAERRRARELEEVAAMARAPQITADGVRALRLAYSESRALAITSRSAPARALGADSPQSKPTASLPALREPIESEARGLNCSPADLRGQRTVKGAAQ